METATERMIALLEQFGSAGRTHGPALQVPIVVKSFPAVMPEDDEPDAETDTPVMAVKHPDDAAVGNDGEQAERNSTILESASSFARAINDQLSEIDPLASILNALDDLCAQIRDGCGDDRERIQVNANAISCMSDSICRSLCQIRNHLYRNALRMLELGDTWGKGAEHVESAACRWR